MSIALRRAITMHSAAVLYSLKGGRMSDERVLKDMPVIGRIDLHEIERRDPLPSERFAESIEVGLTFDDVLLRPAKSDIHPNFVEVGTQLTRDIRLNIPLTPPPPPPPPPPP